ncbi:MAG: ATP-grasp domain-containing protein, partial [Rhodospirillales bacterium]|nr:ATP-grasp domain-containing protein [Rhodospirillales bacterium]
QMRDRAKDHLPALCQRLSIAVPDTRTISDAGFFDRCADEGWDYPLVVKGIYYDAAVVAGSEQAKAAFLRIAREWGYPVLVQRFVEGHEINLTALGDGSGAMIAPVMMRKRAVTDKGKAWAGIAIQDDALESMAAALIAELRWPGGLEVEALRGEDGRLYLIEINPRLPAWIYLTHGVGRNLPVTQLRLMAGERNIALPPPRPGTMFIRHAKELIVGLDAFEAILTGGALALKADSGCAA